MYSLQACKARLMTSETDECITDIYKPFNLSITLLEVVITYFMESLTLFILYTWEIILNILDESK